MTRQETQIIKGIALIMMLWLHLFSNAEQTLILGVPLKLDSLSIAYVLHEQLFEMRYPVLIFLLLVIFCYLSSIILNIILKPIYRFLKLT